MSIHSREISLNNMAETSLYRIPNEAVHDGMVTNTEFFPPAIWERIREFPMGEEDVLIASYPKSGTTWMQELAYSVNQYDDIEKTKSIPIFLRSKFLEIDVPGMGSGLDLVLGDPHPWVMKSHLPVRYFTKQLAEAKVKVITVMRNPKDNLVSFYHFYKNNSMLGNFEGTWEEFFELFKAKHLRYGDMLEWNADWWSKRENKNVLIVKYEDMKKDIRDVIRQVALHCGKSLDDKAVETIASNVSMDAMRQNPVVNPELMKDLPFKVVQFLRKGEVGDWRNYFSPEQEAYVDERCKQTYKPVGLEFEY